MTTKVKTKKRTFSGVVVSVKTPKTLVARVASVKTHPKYGKQYLKSKKYKVHYESGDYEVGDQVSFVECRPISKDKKWRVIK